MSVGPDRLWGHKDWAAGRKSDPRYSMDWMRGLVAARREPEPKVRPMYEPPVVLEPIVGSCPAPGGGAWLVAASGAVYAFHAPFYGGTHGQPWFSGRKAARIDPASDAERAAGKHYVITATTGERYAFPV